MSYRVCRKFISHTFQMEGQLCKIFLEPIREYRPGFWAWNTGFAIGQSRRQLNDWYWRRKNKRRRSIDNHFNGKSGIKPIITGFSTVLRLRWNIAPGDCLIIDSTSRAPDKQFHAFSRWCRYHPEWSVDHNRKEFIWYRPPYPDDQVWNHFEVLGVAPSDPLANTAGDAYFSAFSLRPKGQHKHQSTFQIADLYSQAPEN